MRVVASLFISFLRFHFSGFSFRLCAVDAFFLLQFQATWSSVEVLHGQNRFAGPRVGAQAPPGWRCTERKLH